MGETTTRKNPERCQKEERTKEGAEEAKESGLGDDKPAVNDQITLTFHQGEREKRRLHKTYEEINISLISKHKDVLDNLVEKFQ